MTRRRLQVWHPFDLPGIPTIMRYFLNSRVEAVARCNVITFRKRLVRWDPNAVREEVRLKRWLDFSWELDVKFGWNQLFPIGICERRSSWGSLCTSKDGCPKEKGTCISERRYEWLSNVTLNGDINIIVISVIGRMMRRNQSKLKVL